MEAHGAHRCCCAACRSIGWPRQPGLIFTERRADLRRHAGEISFPGGRRDHPDEALLETALREAEEEIGLPRPSVEVVGALPPIGTFVTCYKVHPFVGLVEQPRSLGLKPSPAEVETVLAFSLESPARGLRDAPPGPARRADPDPDLHGR